MKWTFRTLLQKSKSTPPGYSLTFYDGSIDDDKFPIRGVSFSSPSSLRQFLNDILRRQDSQVLIDQCDATSLAIEFWQSLDEQDIHQINKLAESVL